MKVLAIESTCDETSAAIVETCGGGVRVIANIVASSAEIHKKYGGVVPEVAAREQIRSIIPVINEAINKSGEKFDYVAVSYGPGLMGSLLVGVETAKTLSWIYKKPLVRVNHMCGHVLANWIVENEKKEVPEFPTLGLVVSGGHTDLVYLENFSEWRWLGGTRDDAAGEAYDKAAKILNLPYPGGPEIDNAAQKVTDDFLSKNKNKYKLPRPLLHEDSLEMSFSGLKSALVRLVETQKLESTEDVGLVAWEFNEAVIDVLANKVNSAILKTHPKSVILAGGVAANKKLRARLASVVKNYENMGFFVPELKYCGDNAGMIGAAALLKTEVADLKLKPSPGLETVSN